VITQLRFQAVEPPGKTGPVRRYQGDMSNPLRPDLMTPAERLEEIADILAAGLMRLRARKSSQISGDPGESSLDFSPDRRGHARPRERAHMTDTVLAKVAALKTARTPDLKQQWRELFGTEPPPYNRRFLESRLAYRIQELAYGGLKPETIERLAAIAEDLDGGDADRRRRRAGQDRPIAGTRLIREWKGVEHCVTVRDEDFEYQGRPYKSLSAVARAITGTRWNGLLFFGLKNHRAAR
jgi:hypothetical protein